MATDHTTGDGANDGVSSFAFPRYEQTFPELTPQEIARMRRFGEPKTYTSGETLFETGKVGPGMFVILRSDESAAEIEERCSRRLPPLFSNENHGVYRVR